jgi:hypothetical protein
MKIDKFKVFNEKFGTGILLSKVDNIIRKLKNSKDSNDIKVHGGKMYSSESDASYGFELDSDRISVSRIPKGNLDHVYKIKINGEVKKTSDGKAERLFSIAEDIHNNQH